MTLHLTQVSGLYTIQVSDRKVSGRIDDALANKNLIYWARDAIVTLGYTGLAYDLAYPDRAMPTDEWIASKLLGGVIPRGRDGVRPATFGGVSDCPWLGIAESLQTLKVQLEGAVRRLPPELRKYSFELTIAGWQFPYRKIPRSFVAEIVKPPDELSVRIDFPMRYRRFGSSFGLWGTPGGYLTTNEARELGVLLRSGNLPPEGRADLAEQALVDAIRRVASRERGVGPHCMSVLLPPPGTAPIRVRFLPTVQHRAVFRGKGWQRDVPVAYTPWVVGNCSFFAPSIIAGGGMLSYTMGPFTVEFEGPRSEGAGLFVYTGAHTRPRR